MALPSNTQPVFVGRQPIFDARGLIVGFELLFRGGHSASAPGARHPDTDADATTSDLLRSIFVDIGVENLVGDRLAFMTLPRHFLDSDLLAALPAGQTVLEIFRDCPLDPDSVGVARALAARGFRLVMDARHLLTDPAVAREVAAIVRIDIRGLERTALARLAEGCASAGVAMLAEKVGTEAEYQLARRLGFTYFQGFFLSYPNVVEGRRMGGGALALLRLLEMLQRADSTLDELERLVTSDAALSIEMLKLVNSARFRRPDPIESIRQALLLLGRKLIGQWALLLSLRAASGNPQAMELALIRARMSELLASVCGRKEDAERFFTLGLLSGIDRLFGVPLAEILRQIHLSPEMTAALLNREGQMALVLEVIDAFEHTDNPLPDELDISPEALSRLYLDAISWTRARLSEL
ncbi:HDOD domain-containing protein [uncultured Thiocystis sp.]|jgi:EAL and modified HD-GYP domain-containing signal transduction protein|uniref:EAL and HDOD domain-containing protein n=1 Tax=uncultured Thiocystis sp. TaxID=1202134 RepID=UPI0025E16992|nr:HDOD domain-containing protein [uncultured Thiocystis sp.]